MPQRHDIDNYDVIILCQYPACGMSRHDVYFLCHGSDGTFEAYGNREVAMCSLINTLSALSVYIIL